MKKKNVLIIGATAALVQETIQLFARDQAHLILVGRNEGKLNIIAQDLKTKWDCMVSVHVMDFCGFNNHQHMLDLILDSVGDIDVLLIAHGVLMTQEELQKDLNKTLELMHVNFTSVVSILMTFSNYMEKRKQGLIAVISSVAGDRGRKKNYVYGSSKAALSAYVQGLRNRLLKSGVHVLDIKPGLIDTPMTADIKKGFLCSDAKTVGRDIYKAIRSKKDVLYTPWYWDLIMFFVRITPEFIFKRLNF